MTTVSIKRDIRLPSINDIRTNTAFKKRKTAMAVIETLKWLAAGAPEDNFNGFDTPITFDMSCYIEKDNEFDEDCGTSCCMAGAIRLFEKHRIPKNDKSGEDLDRHYALGEHGVEIPQLYKLFYGYPNSKPEQAFATLLNYCQTGVVDWNHKV